ncbi:MAG: hypothetical protein ABL993_10385 [Vicinamibacterales bacterium]
MKLLFYVRHYAYLRLFESALTELAERGHHVHLAADREEAIGGQGMVERLAARYPGITMGPTPGRAPGAWDDFAHRLRLGIDHLRYLEPRYDSTPHLAARARARAPRVAVKAAEILRRPWQRRLLASVLLGFERGLPPARDIEAHIRRQAPDLVLITPLIALGSPQMDHLAAAKRLGVKTVLPVGSWDHLSSKALIRSTPDLVLVWNEIQKREATEMHGVEADRVVVTGAQVFDQWFNRSPSRDRDAFCARVGLRPDRPYVLYLCSSLFRGTANEAFFVEQWVGAVRASADPRLKDIGILIRPHPQRLNEWKHVHLTHRNLVFWGDLPITGEAKDDYFDSMYYASAVVGLNTSAFLEAAVVGKPVLTVLDPEISRDNQEGTIHFRYLLEVNGGLLRVARSLDEHTQQLADSLVADGGSDPKAARFVEGFIRPFGRDVPATPRFVDALERLAAAPASSAHDGGVTRFLWRLPAYPFVGILRLMLDTQPWRKRVRREIRKALMDGRRRIFVALKHFAQTQLGEKELAPTPAAPSSPLAPKPGRQRDPAKRFIGSNLPEAEEAREAVTLLGRSGRPIIIGPWLSETGFELLYWIPFVAWAKAHGNFDPEQLIVISRGGAAPWYRHITSQYEDVFAFYTPEEFRHENEGRIAGQRGRLKHVEVSPFDREIIRRVTDKRQLKDAQLLHPSMMYELFDHFWFQRVPLPFVEAFTKFAPLPAVDLGPLRQQLPDRYIAAKFYGNAALPESPENRAFVASYLEELTRHTDVVLLNTGHRFDDHEDMPRAVRARLHSVEHLMTPQNNLDLQTRIISGAQAFVGTYGGFSYLAPFYGIDTLAFYSHVTGFRHDHLEVAKRVFSSMRQGSFIELDIRALDLLRLGLGDGESVHNARGAMHNVKA